MKVRLVKEFRFEAAHLLPRVPAGHKCARLHGHSFKVEFGFFGPVDPDTGWFIDFGEIDTLWQPLYDALDHRYLNEIEGLENPTSEVLARWIWRRLDGVLPGLCLVTVQETCEAGVEYDGRDS